MAAGAVTAPSIIPLRLPVAGKSQTEIDTNTYIELKTDFPETQIYFTIDGSKPDPFQQIGVRKTQQYKKPFLLQEGRKTVRAIAITKNRESNIVSKTFTVEWAPGQEKYETDDESFQDRIARKQTPGLQLTASKTTAAIMKKVLEESQKPVQGSNYRKPTTGTRFMEARLGSKPTGTAAKEKAKHNGQAQQLTSPKPEDKGKAIPKNLTQANRLQRETDFLKCIFCAADRPADPFARFCIACGNPVPPLPNARLPPPEPAQLGMCVGCNAMVPLNVTSCLICEMPIAPQLVPQASVKLKDKLVCNECGTGNPANMEYCVTCECPLTGNNRHLKMVFPEATHSGASAPPLPMKGGRLLCCNKCGRVNNSDARFCDWCGAKPAPTTHLLTCSRCQSSNQAYATFCHSCGCSIEPPPREDPRNNGITVGGRSTSQVIDKQAKAAWVPMSMPHPEPEKITVGTQTAGLFFPSNKRLEQQGKGQGDQRILTESAAEKKPVLTAVSPGKGYWRQQMDHICGHLKAHAQNNQDFRNLIAEPRMGKLQGATVHEDGYELSITACFVLRGSKDDFTGKPLGITKKSLLSDTTDVPNEVFTKTSHALGTSAKQEKPSTPKKKLKKKAADDKLTAIDRDLLKELGAKGDGDEEEVQRLLDEGADAVCETSEGIPVLAVAAMNRHWDSLETLVNNGAEINKKAGPKGNTALHEAVLLGRDGRQGVEELLALGASSKVKNARDETAYDLAIKGGEEAIISLFASTAGQGMLDKLMKQSSRPPAERF
ncbi:double zinc ribbon and ankyrin repeat-containing protein 1-like isoform X3 [Acanthaster planci]|uniref:Double zinc ribbon and ankyrin repeat-containing protein 1 n=1 Tax=Acanthaster planci TaxID=133434 RepID=A0A8B7Z3P1_ACAPL|nr:double zinc ribbon and ankyrin repeat-containing protein 1-like isoform X3 [Acanthaster planci]